MKKLINQEIWKNNCSFVKIIKLIFLCAFIIYSYKQKILVYNQNLIITSNDTFTNRNGNIYLNLKLINRFNAYIKECINNKLIDSTQYINNSKNPKISVIMPIFNGEKYIHYSLRSIQNQKMKNMLPK